MVIFYSRHHLGGFHGHGGTSSLLDGFSVGKSKNKMDDLGVPPWIGHLQIGGNGEFSHKLWGNGLNSGAECIRNGPVPVTQSDPARGERERERGRFQCGSE